MRCIWLAEQFAKYGVSPSEVGRCTPRDLVLLVRDEVAPLNLRAVLRYLPHSEVGHEIVGSSSMPVPFAWWGVDGVAGADGDDLTASRPRDALRPRRT